MFPVNFLPRVTALKTITSLVFVVGDWALKTITSLDFVMGDWALKNATSLVFVKGVWALKNITCFCYDKEQSFECLPKVAYIT